MNYLTSMEIIAINAYLTKRYQPRAKINLENPQALSVAVLKPQKKILNQDVYPNLVDKAETLLDELTKNKIFTHANQQTALVAVLIFFKINGIELSIDSKRALELAKNWQALFSKFNYNE